MLFLNKFLIQFYLLTFCVLHACSTIYYMEPGERIAVNESQRRFSERTIQTFCYKGRPKYIIHLWQTVSLQLSHNGDNYIHYDGSSPQEIEEKYTAHHSSWSLNLFTWKQTHFKLDPFNLSCIGVESNESYNVYLHVIRIDYWKVLLLLSGIFIFLSSPSLSGNALFYYLCGISLGICASFLILIYFVSKLFPKKPMMYGFVVGGWAVGIYVLQMLWENLRTILTTYKEYVFWYMFITGFISFVLCYRLGPPVNPRSKNLIKWTLQAVGLIMMFASSHFQEAAMGIIMFLLVSYNIPKAWVSKSKTYWKRKFPPKVQLLSNDQYYQQGVKETNKALSELRKYCSSPNCNQWKTVLKLQNAKRFASFVEGTSHLSDEEILEYENDSFHRSETDLTDDEDISEESNISQDM